MMGENRAYPLWLYPRIHVHSRDPTGSLRTSSDWTIKQTTWSPIDDDQTPMISHHQTPICQRPSPLGGILPPVLSQLSVGLFLDMSHVLCHFPLFYSHHAQPLYPCFMFSLRLCAPLVHSFPDSSSDVSLFISLTDPHAFVLC